jgi:hypothetical protein
VEIHFTKVVLIRRYRSRSEWVLKTIKGLTKPAEESSKEVNDGN